MSLPLYEKSTASLGLGGNAGLYHTKFFDRWSTDFENIDNGEKLAWIQNIAGQAITPVPASAIQRMQTLAESTRGDSRTYSTTGPFVTGMGLPHGIENGFLFHHTLGVPYLPGSSVKGMMRAWAEQWCEDKELAHRLFGRPTDEEAGVGCIVVFDALPVGGISLVAEGITPHTGDWRIAQKPDASKAPADWISPNPIPFLAVGEGQKFQFSLGLRGGADEGDLRVAFEYLEAALQWIGAGAKTAIGFGRFLSDAQLEAKHNEWARREESAVADAAQSRLLEEQKSIKGNAAKIQEIIKTNGIFPKGTGVILEGDIRATLVADHKYGVGNTVQVFIPDEGGEDRVGEVDIAVWLLV